MAGLSEIIANRNSENEQTFLGALEEFVEKIKLTFTHPQNVTDEMLMLAIAELIPRNEISQVVDTLEVLNFSLSHKDDPDPAYPLIHLLYTSSLLKENIIEKVVMNDEAALSLDEQISRAEHAPKTPEVTKELETLLQIKDVINKHLSLDPKGRMERLFVIASMFESLVARAPAPVVDHPLQNSTVRKNITALYKSLTTIAEDSTANENVNLDEVAAAELMVSKMTVALTSRIAVMLKAQAQTVPSSSLSSIAELYEKVVDAGDSLLATETDLSRLHESSDNFALLYTRLMENIMLLENDPATVKALQSQQNYVQQSNDREFPQEDYPYLFSAEELLKSENVFLQAQLDINKQHSKEVTQNHNSSKFFSVGNNDFHRLEVDLERNLRIENEKITLKGQELRTFLIKKFGAANATQVIKHYDQGISYLVSGLVASSVAAPDIMDTSVFSPGSASDVSQNLFKFQDTVFRDVAVKEFVLKVTEDKFHPEWHLKINFKVVSHSTPDGFSILHVGTDSPLICNAIMNKTVHDEVKKLVQAILVFETSLSAKHHKFTTKETFKNKKRQFIDIVMLSVNEFREGKITFESFCESMDKHAKVALTLKHDGLLGKAREVVSGKKPGTTDAVVLFNTTLQSLHTEITEKAKSYVRFDSITKAPEEIATRPRRG
jgi:hypothetical protein